MSTPKVTVRRKDIHAYQQTFENYWPVELGPLRLGFSSYWKGAMEIANDSAKSADNIWTNHLRSKEKYQT